jgi:hypothetical protein
MRAALVAGVSTGVFLLGALVATAQAPETTQEVLPHPEPAFKGRSGAR